MTKDAVRGVAHSAGFSWIARKKEVQRQEGGVTSLCALSLSLSLSLCMQSYGLCFVGKRNKFTTFLSNVSELEKNNTRDTIANFVVPGRARWRICYS